MADGTAARRAARRCVTPRRGAAALQRGARRDRAKTSRDAREAASARSSRATLIRAGGKDRATVAQYEAYAISGSGAPRRLSGVRVCAWDAPALVGAAEACRRRRCRRCPAAAAPPPPPPWRFSSARARTHAPRARRGALGGVAGGLQPCTSSAPAAPAAPAAAGAGAGVSEAARGGSGRGGGAARRRGGWRREPGMRPRPRSQSVVVRSRAFASATLWPGGGEARHERARAAVGAALGRWRFAL